MSPWRGSIRGSGMTERDPSLAVRSVDSAGSHEAAAPLPPDEEETLVALEVPGESTVVPAPRPSDAELEIEAEREDPLGALSYRRLVWRRFRKSRLGIIGGTVLLLFYTVAL